MADYKDIVKLAVDAYHGKQEKYSVSESMDTLRQALVEANGGKTTLDYKAIRDGKCGMVFTIVEEILSRTIVEGLQGDEYFNTLVDFRNINLGDRNEFVVEDSNLFVVSDATDGTQGIRRQRLGGSSTTSIPTMFKVVKIYEELNRVLAGQVDFNTFIQRVSESFRKKLLDDIYALWNKATAADFGGETYFPAAGTYDEDTLIDVINHVEAAAGGKKATLIGTTKALRNLAPSIQGAESRSDLYNLGYYGRFYGNPVIAVPQRHKVGSTDFVFDDKTITVIAGDDKPIKCVYEGQSTILVGDPMANKDLTQEYLYGEKYGLGIVLAGGNAGIGRYEMN